MLTDGAHWTMKTEVAFKEAKKVGNINWEDIEFTKPTESDDA